MAAGSIVIDLLMRTGSFETDTDRASKRLKQLEKEIDKVASAVGVALGAAVIGASVAFDQLIKSVADFKDFEEIAGGPAEGFASLAIAAAGAGVAMDSIVGSTVKLTKGLVGVDDESQAVGAALKSIGIEVSAFKKLNPVEQYEAVGKALAKFADGAEKTAVAQALFGKSGAEQLKVFKALEEQGGRNVRLTQEQIEAADRYADAQAVAMANLTLFGQELALRFLPSVTDAIEAFSDLAEGAEFAGTVTAALEFAFDTAVAVFQTLAIVGSDVAFVLTTIGKEAGAAAAQLAALAVGDLAGFRAISKAVEEDTKRARAELDAFQKAILDIGKPKPQATDYGDYMPFTGDKRDKINFGGADTEASKKRREQAKEAEDMARRQVDAEEQSAKESAEAWSYWQGYRLKESQETADAWALQQKQVLDFIDQQYAEEIEAGQAFLETKTEELSEFMKQGLSNIQDFVGGSLADALEGDFDRIDENFGQLVRKLIAQAAAAQLNEWLFGNKGNNGALAAAARAIGGLFSGAGNTGGPYEYTDSSGAFSMVPQGATGTNRVERDGFAYLHKDEAIFPAEFNPFVGGEGIGGRQQIIIENHGADVEQRSDIDGTVRLIVKMAEDRIAGGLAAGTGPAAAALKSRGINLSGGIQRRA